MLNYLENRNECQSVDDEVQVSPSNNGTNNTTLIPKLTNGADMEIKMVIIRNHFTLLIHPFLKSKFHAQNLFVLLILLK